MARKKSNYRAPKYYTTYQVAKFLGVSLPTVVNWVNSGLLAAHRTPGGHRRIAHADIVSFARDNDYPLARELLDSGDGPKRILIVDDEQDFSEMLRDYLTLKGGFEVDVADSGFQAGFTVARSRPDLILMDLMMPDMNGFDAFRMLRGDPETQHIPIVACTAYRDPTVDERVEDLRFDGFVEKPVQLEQLLALVRKKVGLD